MTSAGVMSSGPLARRAASAFSWSVIGSLFRALSGFLFQLILARMLGPAAYGQFSILMAFLAVGWLLADAGYGAALIQKSELNDEDIHYALTWVFLVGIGLALLLALAAGSLATFFDDPALKQLLWATAALVPLQAMANIPVSLLKRNLQQKTVQLAQLVGYVSGMALLAVPMALAGAGAWSLVAASALQTLITLVWAYLGTRHSIGIRLGGDLQMRRFGLTVLGSNLVNSGIEYFDRLVVGGLWGVRHAGLYSTSINAARTPVGVFLPPLQSVIFPATARMAAQKQSTRLAFVGTTNLAMLVSLPLFAWLAANSDAVITLLYGRKWLDAAPLLMATCSAMPLYVVSAIAGSTLMGLGMARQEFLSQGVVLAVLLSGFLMLQHQPFSIAVWVMVVAYAIRALVLCIALAKAVEATGRDLMRAMAGGTCLALGALAVCIAVSWMPPWGTYSAMAVSAVLILVASVGLLVALPRLLLTEELRRLILTAAGASTRVRAAFRMLRVPLE